MGRKFKTGLVFLIMGLLISAILGMVNYNGAAPTPAPLYKNSKASASDRAMDLLKQMSIDEKVGQMVQGERQQVTPDDVKKYMLGSVLSGGGSTPGSDYAEDWIGMMKYYSNSANSTRLGIPIIYGVDAVHGHNLVYGATIFPHNIALGAANDPDLMKKIAAVTGAEMLSTGITWTFGPCVAVAKDPRWGRYYESYGEDPALVSKLSVPLITTLQNIYHIAGAAKHYAADGGTAWGTGDSGYSIDQGNAEISEAVMKKEFLAPYEAAVKAGVKTVMVSFNSWNGLKDHENKHLIQEILKDQMGFKGFVVSDWEGIHQLRGRDFYHQVVTGVNAGIDMLMEPNAWEDAITDLRKAEKNGDIKISRIDDAVFRILKVKFELGLFENPLGDKANLKSELGTAANRNVARQAVRESLVLLKNQNNVLPLKKNAKIFITGPGAGSVGLDCGGWTIDWQGNQRKQKGTSILNGFMDIATKNNGKIIRDVKKINEASVAVVVMAEDSYAEGKGDDGDLSLTNGTGNYNNLADMAAIKKAGIPVVVILVSGRPRIVTDNINSWDAFVEAWLPGSEGEGVSNVLYGDYNFRGKLPVNWPKSTTGLPIKDVDTKNILFPRGFGLTMK
jgi:beta-glucosidase